MSVGVVRRHSVHSVLFLSIWLCSKCVFVVQRGIYKVVLLSDLIFHGSFGAVRCHLVLQVQCGAVIKFCRLLLLSHLVLSGVILCCQMVICACQRCFQMPA